MINLLPTKEKEILRGEQTTKLVIILGITILSFLICLTLVLSSIYFFVLGEANSANFSFQEVAKKYQSPDFTALQAVIQKYNKILPQVYSFYSGEKRFSDALNIIYAIPRPDGLSFLNLSLDGTKQDGPKGTLGVSDKKEIFVSITGTSVTREALVTYQDNLAKEARIENVSFSPESWINSKNINFNVSFSLFENGE